MRNSLSLDSANRVDQLFSSRSPRRQYLVGQLHAAGRRPLLEALIEIEAGHSVDGVLERFATIPPEVYRLLGADQLPIDSVAIFDGGRA
jgi:hypothetical protein